MINFYSNLKILLKDQLFKVKNRKCLGCEKFIDHTAGLTNYPKIENSSPRVFSEETAYQMTSILSGAVKRGTAKKLRSLNVPLAGKTGTTNDNYDAWFIGFSSNLVIGVYIGFDNPKTLGKYETGSKTALPIFKSFIESAINKSETRPFKAAKGTIMMVVDPNTGQKAKFTFTARCNIFFSNYFNRYTELFIRYSYILNK